MRSDLVPVFKLLGEMQEQHRRLEQSYEHLVASASQLASLYVALSNAVKRAPGCAIDTRPVEEQSLRLQQALDTRSRMAATLSNLLKKQQETANSILQNIK